MVVRVKDEKTIFLQEKIIILFFGFCQVGFKKKVRRPKCWNSLKAALFDCLSGNLNIIQKGFKVKQYKRIF